MDLFSYGIFEFILQICDKSSCNTCTVSQGGTKDQEAVYIYEELIDKHGGSSMLLCGLAVAKMHLGQFEEAEARLQEALIKVLFFNLLYGISCLVLIIVVFEFRARQTLMRWLI